LAPGTVAKDRPVEGLAVALGTCSIARHDLPCFLPRLAVNCSSRKARSPLCERASK
jgi:hypothetical protein